MASSSPFFYNAQHLRRTCENENVDGGILRNTPSSSQSFQSSCHTPFYTPMQPSPHLLDPSDLTPMRKMEYNSTPAHHLTPNPQHRGLSAPPQQFLLSHEQKSNDTAAAFARTSPQAGFLYKLGSNKQEFQRRFFVLKPSTHLYYFVSPHDTEPRGCIDLDGSQIEPLQTLPEGVIRFAIRLADQEKPVILEARLHGPEWIESLQTQRLGFCQQELLELQQRNVGYKNRITDLEKQVRDFQLIEKDRDGAIEDAANWKNRHEELNDAIRLLTQCLLSSNDDEDLVTKSPDFSTFDATIETQFPALHNACQQLKERLGLLGMEASTAVEDLQTVLQAKLSLEKRMLKAEKHICTLWDENTALRQEMKVIRKEKRVLVKEVKTLRARTTKNGFLQDGPIDEVVDDKESIVGMLLDKEGERLMEELEAQVKSSIRLQEEIMASNQAASEQFNRSMTTLEELDRSDSAETAKVVNSANGAGLEDHESRNHSRASPIEPKVLSLIDDESSDDSDDDEEEVTPNDRVSGLASSASLVDAEAGSGSNVSLADLQEMSSVYDIDSDLDSNTTQRRHPLTTLDDNEVDFENEGGNNAMKSIFTQNGRATSRLECRLADVVETRATTRSNGDAIKDDGVIYHLTFYSRKIGIQFQKVPPPSAPNGLLTEAMTADICGNTHSNATASELRRIADMTKRARGDGQNHYDTTCQVADPVDAVLVCGFLGFDDTANHVRPNLGARLVAFDGISVEFGKWTFESIRKAIQARGRPLTLSFRNDFLTTKQRAILTQAVTEVNAMVLPSRLAIQNSLATNAKVVTLSSRQRGHSMDSLYDAEPLANDSIIHDEAESVSTSGSSNNQYRTFSAVSSVATSTNDFRSFSDAGASSVFTSTLGPIMGKLLYGASKPDVSITPAYLSRRGESLNEMPSHQDYQNSLL